MDGAGAIIASARTIACTVPLRTPYVLSFVTLREVTARLVQVTTESGRVGLGEVVALPGYGDETDDDIAQMHGELVPALAGRSIAEARADVLDRATARPFATSAMLAALDVAADVVPIPDRVDQPLVSAIATDAPDAMLAAIADRRAAGARTIKIKFGRDLDADLASIGPVLDGVPDDVRLRFDANQAYDEDGTRRVLAAFDHPRRDRVELLEQPLGVDEASWEAFERVAADAPIPLMLDESIESAADIDRAAAVGATWVKLKACKGAGVAELRDLATRARGLGLRVILGNGVATDVANLFEACVRAGSRDLFDGAGEDNGFAKLTRPLLAHPPQLVDGSMRWTAPSATADPWALAGDIVTPS